MAAPGRCGGVGAAFGRPECTPHSFGNIQKNAPCTVEEKMFGGLSERKAPQSLYAGVVFADVVKVVGSLRRTAGDWWTTKDFTRNLPTKTSYCLSHPCCRTLAVEDVCRFDVGREKVNCPAGAREAGLGRDLGPPLIGAQFGGC